MSSNGGPPAATEASPILSNLSGEESSNVLLELVVRHHVPAAELEELAVSVLSARSPEDVAAELVAAIECIDLHDLTARTAFNHEADAALGLFRRALGPFLEDIRRYSSMGLHEVAIRTCQGVLLGLFTADEEGIEGIGNFFFEGFVEYADAPLLALPGTARDPVGNVIHVPETVKSFAREHLPHWDWLHD